jgi:hypothetical protein
LQAVLDGGGSDDMQIRLNEVLQAVQIVGLTTLALVQLHQVRVGLVIMATPSEKLVTIQLGTRQHEATQPLHGKLVNVRSRLVDQSRVTLVHATKHHRIGALADDFHLAVRVADDNRHALASRAEGDGVQHLNLDVSLLLLLVDHNELVSAVLESVSKVSRGTHQGFVIRVGRRQFDFAAL